MRLTFLAAGSGILSLVSALPSNNPVDIPKRQYEATPPTYEPALSSDQRAQAVIDTFRTSWDGYRQYAFPMDELRPVNNTGSNSRYDQISLSEEIRANMDSGTDGERLP
jgi:mannosyl-oligosaccharide alpha-1,2-mannosidase